MTTSTTSTTSTTEGARARQVGVVLWRVAFVLAVGVHLAVLYWPRAPSTGGLPIDKVVHATIFGGVLWVGARAGVPVRWLIGVLALHAVGSELIQHFLLPNRSGGVLDAAADLAGVLIVTLILRRRD